MPHRHFHYYCFIFPSKGIQNEDFEKKFEVTIGDEMIEVS